MRITTVRISVARSGWIPATPTFANTAVSAAKTADSSAHTCHDAIPVALTAPPSGRGQRVSHTAAAKVTRAPRARGAADGRPPRCAPIDLRRHSYYFRAG